MPLDAFSAWEGRKTNDRTRAARRSRRAGSPKHNAVRGAFPSWRRSDGLSFKSRASWEASREAAAREVRRRSRTAIHCLHCPALRRRRDFPSRLRRLDHALRQREIRPHERRRTVPMDDTSSPRRLTELERRGLRNLVARERKRRDDRRREVITTEREESRKRRERSRRREERRRREPREIRQRERGHFPCPCGCAKDRAVAPKTRLNLGIRKGDRLQFASRGCSLRALPRDERGRIRRSVA